jgi:DNA-binding CsgD family transcriptional regulator
MPDDNNLIDLIGRLYGAAIGREDWESVLNHLSAILDDGTMAFQRIPVRPFSQVIPLALASRQRGVPIPPHLPVGSIIADGTALSEPGQATKFYGAVLKPHGLRDAIYWLDSDRRQSAVILTLWRPRRPSGWTPAQLGLLRATAPHLDRALAVLRQLEAAAGHRMAAAPPRPTILLTGRERDCLVLVARGGSNKEIARQLGLSVYTVEDHVKSLIRKLQVSSRTEVVTTALRLGLLTPHPPQAARPALPAGPWRPVGAENGSVQPALQEQ